MTDIARETELCVCGHMRMNHQRHTSSHALGCSFIGCACAGFVRKQPGVAEPETVNHPDHYGGDTVYEVIKVLEAWRLGFHLGNTVKYIARAGKKDDSLEDLKKARWYLDRKIKMMDPDD